MNKMFPYNFQNQFQMRKKKLSMEVDFEEDGKSSYVSLDVTDEGIETVMEQIGAVKGTHVEQDANESFMCRGNFCYSTPGSEKLTIEGEPLKIFLSRG